MTKRRASARLLALVFALPVDVIPARQLHLRVDLLDGFFHRAAQVAAAHAVLDGDVALVPFAIDFGGAVAFFDLAELLQRDSFARGRQQANIFQRFSGVTVLGEIPHHQVVALLALKYLGQSVASHGGLDRILHIRDVDLIARGLLAVHFEVFVGLAEDAKDSKILDSLDAAHDADNLVGLGLQDLQDRRRRPWWRARPSPR